MMYKYTDFKNKEQDLILVAARLDDINNRGLLDAISIDFSNKIVVLVAVNNMVGGKYPKLSSSPIDEATGKDIDTYLFKNINDNTIKWTTSY